MEFRNEPFVVATLVDGKKVSRPLSDFGGAGFVEMALRKEGFDVVQIETVRCKWWVRLGQPDYLRASEWYGPFNSKTEAQGYTASL